MTYRKVPMKVIILCGGMGTRLAEETTLKPKPMVEIGGKPILWHIMSLYSHFGFNEFVLALGYKGEVIKSYFLNYATLNSDFELDLATGNMELVRPHKTPWKIKLVDTGQESMTGGRLLRLKKVPGLEKPFMLTYGDGVTNLDIKNLVKFHQSHGKLVSVTAVRPLPRFGGMSVEGDQVVQFSEKKFFQTRLTDHWINGGFFVMEPGIFDYLSLGDQTVLETTPMEKLTQDRQLMAYKHEGFWQCMDMARDRQFLEELWGAKKAPWKLWDS